MVDIAHTLAYNDCWTGSPPEHFEGYQEASPIIKAIVRDFVNHKKIISSRQMAHQVIRAGLLPGVVITDEDIQTAYDIGAGGGFEYDWNED